MNDKANKVASDAIERYNKRYEQLGKDVRTLGWGSVEQQLYRFEQTLSCADFTNKHILDIGCGFADYYTFLLNKNVAINHYTGWDINELLVNEAKGVHKKYENISLETRNVVNEDQKDISDIGITLGTLNFNLKGDMNNYEYSFQFIKNAFACVNEVLVVDFLSTQYTPEYPVEDFVFYHDPGKMLNFALSLSPNVVLKHNYAPIPQKEFMLFIYK